MGQRKAISGTASQETSASAQSKQMTGRISSMIKGGDAFSWKSMLAVISSLPPKQLQKLDSLVTTGSSTGGNDFEFYTSYYALVKNQIDHMSTNSEQHLSLIQLISLLKLL